MSYGEGPRRPESPGRGPGEAASARYRVPLGRGWIEFAPPPWAEVDVLTSADAPPLRDVQEAVRGALRAPLGTPPLRDLAAAVVRRLSSRRPRVVIAVTDVTRASPDHLLVPPMLDELRAGGVRDEEVAICVAVGLHRASTDAEKREKLGHALVARHEVFDSDGRDPRSEERRVGKECRL